MSTQLLVGGRIYSSSNPDATAMAVSDGTVVWVGLDKPGRALHPDAEIIELDGAFVAPGFVDPHVHVTALGLKLTGLDLAQAGSLAECLDAVRAYAAARPEGIILGEGWDETRWAGGRPPTVEDIDAAAPGRQVYLARVDAHSAVASTALLDTVPGIGEATGFTRGEPLRADAHHRVRGAALGALSREQRDAARRAALDAAAANGVVAVHECAGPEISGATDVRERLEFAHGVEVRAYWGQAVRTADEARTLVKELGVHALGGDLFVDGALGSHTAWLREPYADRDTTGTSYLDADAIAAHVLACTEAGIQTGFHVIGDAAMDAVVAGFQRAVAELGGPAVASRGHRLEHAEMITGDQIAKLAAWGVIASVQPGFDAAWGGPDGMYATRLGADRAATLNPFAAMASAGISLAIGSDAPVTALSPWDAIRAAAHHRTPGHQISPRAAFAAATRGAWRAGGVRDGVAGTLVPGAPASYAIWDARDLVVAAASDTVQRWSTDPRSRVPGLPPLTPDAALPTCLRTVHRGVTVHEA
ncbi:amidohydrolase [Nocardia seriolae]|uniref:amidohydrolase n=1 Tax=Nocardia seriolae TaxID=37332 RepID=UPI00051A704E|nr:amidohydrolase family protein [Nocardia seriolae]OJF80815.1 amidohydrolase [Nocardia seriolae]QOW35236.1 amidohydrolase family protein [Nocardia seriolae]QUN17299.1 amidohydrolase family protein [Nocardia seriolae]WKY55568.1 amidohydrolase family protein [Nocardia seriolae]GEM23423.1 amidohydrolase [Nocardia seriolae NBRC 15557]